MTKVYASNLDLQQKILNGINKLADNVAVTLGPKGRNVILAKKEGSPVITKDGVTVANFVDLVKILLFLPIVWDPPLKVIQL